MKIVISRELTDLNTYIKALNNHYLAGNKIKKEETEWVYYEAKRQKAKPWMEYPIKITCTWYSKDERKDIDNVAFAKKFILDGLVLAGVIEDDSRKFVRALGDVFYVDKDNPRVEIEIQNDEK